MSLFLSADKRPLGVLIIGLSGLGKSSLLQNMILQDIQAGKGVCVIDPTADLVNVILDWIPPDRRDDCVLFDTDAPIPIDFFSYDQPQEREVLSDQLTALFSLSSSNAPISSERVPALIDALFDANEILKNKKAKGEALDDEFFTFLDLYEFIKKKSVRERVFKLLPHLREDWPPKLFESEKEFRSITERMRKFRRPPLKNIFGPATKRLNIAQIMRENKILLVNLKDTPSDAFIGSLITIKFQQATFARRYIKGESQRTPYYLYIDECDTIINYAEKEFGTMLVRARKYKLCLILATQKLDMLPPLVQKRVSNIGTHIIFENEYRATVTLRGITRQIRTPQRLKPSPSSNAEYIQKRTVDTFTGQNPSVSHTERDDEDYDTIPPEI